jgi:hypothetical protein
MPKPCFALAFAFALETLERLAPNVQVPEAEVNVRFRWRRLLCGRA